MSGDRAAAQVERAAAQMSYFVAGWKAVVCEVPSVL